MVDCLEMACLLYFVQLQAAEKSESPPCATPRTLRSIPLLLALPESGFIEGEKTGGSMHLEALNHCLRT